MVVKFPPGVQYRRFTVADYHRIIDLAHGPAEYLGIGVAHVTADVLVPRS